MQPKHNPAHEVELASHATFFPANAWHQKTSVLRFEMMNPGAAHTLFCVLSSPNFLLGTPSRNIPQAYICLKRSDPFFRVSADQLGAALALKYDNSEAFSAFSLVLVGGAYEKRYPSRQVPISYITLFLFG